MFGRKFTMVAAVQQKAHSEKVVLWNGTDSSGTLEERRVCIVMKQEGHLACEKSKTIPKINF